jgi:hypothetical protein
VDRLRKPKDLKSPPLSLWVVDTIERIRDGIRRYVVSFFDLVSRVGLAFATPTKSSNRTSIVLNALLRALFLENPRAQELAVAQRQG